MKAEITFGTGFDRDSNVIDRAKLALDITAFKTRAAKAFGGYTLLSGIGGYVNVNGQLVEEQSVTIVVILTANELNSEADRVSSVAGLASHIRKVLNQESVLVSFTESADTFVR